MFYVKISLLNASFLISGGGDHQPNAAKMCRGIPRGMDNSKGYGDGCMYVHIEYKGIEDVHR